MTTDSARVETRLTRSFRFAHWGVVRRCALTAYVAVLLAWTLHYGVPAQRELVIAWTCGALAIFCIGRPPWQIVQLALDWGPIVLVLAAYDYTRGAADTLGAGVHAYPMIDFDQFVFFGQTPTAWIQAHLYETDAVTWWDVMFTIVYTSYFIVPFALAGVLWVRDRLEYLRFMKRLVTLALVGLATYIAFPARPPWMADDMGLIDGVQRTTGRGWDVIGLGTANLFSEGQQIANPVAAVPSLHAAFTALVAMFLWNRVRPRLRPLLALYPLAMGLTLIATGEHYFFDVALGWMYAGAVMAGWDWWERRRAGAAGTSGDRRLHDAETNPG